MYASKTQPALTGKKKKVLHQGMDLNAGHQEAILAEPSHLILNKSCCQSRNKKDKWTQTPPKNRPPESPREQQQHVVGNRVENKMDQQGWRNRPDCRNFPVSSSVCTYVLVFLWNIMSPRQVRFQYYTSRVEVPGCVLAQPVYGGCVQCRDLKLSQQFTSTSRCTDGTKKRYNFVSLLAEQWC